jgi:predicted RNase H-like HicB family nuclease
MQEYVLVIHQAEEGGYWAEVPALPGCYTQGETVEEILSRAPDAIGSYVDALRESGKEMPGAEPNVIITTIKVPAEPSAA